MKRLIRTMGFTAASAVLAALLPALASHAGERKDRVVSDPLAFDSRGELVVNRLPDGPSAASAYTFAQSVGTYAPISGGTVLATTCDDNNYNANAIPFTFNYNGTTYTQFSVNCNGFLAMGASVTSSYVPISAAATNNVIVAMGMDQQTNAASSDLSFDTLGTAPNRVLVVQWNNFRNYNQTGDSYNYQIRLHETSNVVEVAYGAFIKNTTSRTPQVGIRGASNADFNNRTGTGAWQASTAGGANTATRTLNQANLPDPGLIWTWTPPNFPPVVSFTSLANTTSTANRALTGVSVVDADGVNATAGTAPRVYFKRATDANAWNDNTSGTDGWKYAEGTVNGPTFDFTIDYSLLNGGTGVSAGTQVQYFVVAQDLNATPLVGIFPGSFAAAPASVNLGASAFPIGGTPASYMISSLMSGTYQVPGAYASLTNAGGMFEALNNNVLSGNVVIEIAGDLTAETGAVMLNQLGEQPAGSNFTVTIMPVGAARTISGSTANGLITLNGADRVTFDGSLGGGGNDQSLTVANTTATGGTVFWLRSANASDGATGNTIKNCLINGNSGSTTVGGILGSGTVLGGDAEAPNSNNTILNNAISKVQNALYLRGGATAGTFDQNWLVTGNTVGSTVTTGKLGFRGMLIGNAANFTISGNTVQGVVSSATSTSAAIGIQVALGIAGGTITGNRISNIEQANTAGYPAYGLYLGSSSAASGVTVANNMIADIVSYSDTSTAFSFQPVGIMITGTNGGWNLYYNSVNLFGSHPGLTGVTMQTALFVGATVTAVDLRNNVFSNSYDNSSSSTDKSYAVYSAAPAGSFTNIDHNDYFASGATGVLGFFAAADKTTLGAWQAATGQDAASISGDPLFVSATDLHITAGSPAIGAGTPITAVTTDIDGGVRNATTPDIGADEFGVVAPVTHTVSTAAVPVAGGNFTPTSATVNDGSTTTFNVAANMGYTINSVSGCGGSFDSGSGVYTTGAITADCTVTANFDVATPAAINVTPTSLAASQGANASSTQTLTIGNTGGSALNWSIAEQSLRPLPAMPHYPHVAQPASEQVGAAAAAVSAQAHAGRGPLWVAPLALLYDNGPLITNAGAGAGGADASALQTSLGNTSLGANISVSGGFRAADDFTVPSGGWNVNTITFFVYQTGSTTTSTINAANLQIWNGPPDQPSSTVVFGDTTTNRLASTAFSNIYRVTETTLTNNQRPIMAVVVTVGTTLPAGTYWLDWQVGGTLASGPWAPAVTIAGATGKPGANGMQFNATTWAALTDGGSLAPQDYPFIVDGAPAVAACSTTADMPWLSLSATSGSTAGGGSSPVTVTFDSTGMSPGNYNGNLCVSSNDTGNPMVAVPVSMTVLAAHTVSTTVTGDGSISPTSATVLNGQTTTFNVAANTGNHIFSVTGCGGSFDTGSGVYTTGPITGDCTVAVLIVPDGASNGIIHAANLNHGIQATIGGTSLNIITSAFDDSGPISGDWDYNFWASSGALRFWPVSTHTAQVAVDGSGQAIAFHNGDLISSALTWSASGATPAAEWLGGTVAAVGVRFGCDGRGLTYPVPGGVCYGFIQVSTSGPSGFPATIVDTTFDGDGNAITVSGLTVLNPPAATVTPSGLFMSAPANGSATVPMNIANAAGSASLNWSIAARQASLQPHVSRNVGSTGKQTLQRKSMSDNANIQPKLDWLAAHASPNRAVAQGGRHGGVTNRATPWMPTGSLAFILDDGSYENNIGWGDSTADVENSALWLNRFGATGALNVDSVSILWPTNTNGTLVGKSVNIVAYYDADADGDPTNAVRLGTDNLQTIVSLDAFETYTTNFSVPGSGDVYIGFFNTYANGGTTPMLYPAAIDTDSITNASWIAASSSGDGNLDLGANDAVGTIDDLSGGSLTGTWLIRATATVTGGGAACTGPVVSWLTATPASGTVVGGANSTVNVTANPAAGSLAPGSYSAELCVTTNDPAQALIVVPVSLTVTVPPPAFCDGGTDEVFCDGFDPAIGGDIYESGPINHLIQNNVDGTSVNWITGDVQDADVPNYHFNPYNNSVQLTFWWQTGAPDIAGVSSDASTSDFLVLASGAVVGPASIWSTTNNPGPAAWAAGADGYLGFRFNCSSIPNPPVSGICYGYVHLQTTAPNGFPATILDYAYNKVGDPITIP